MRKGKKFPKMHRKAQLVGIGSEAEPSQKNLRKNLSTILICGLGSSSGKALGYGLDGPGSIPGVGWVPGAFLGGKGGRA